MISKVNLKTDHKLKKMISWLIIEIGKRKNNQKDVSETKRNVSLKHIIISAANPGQPHRIMIKGLRFITRMRSPTGTAE